MKDFNYYQPTEIRFGCGRVSEVGDVIKKFGTKCLIVTPEELADFFVFLCSPRASYCVGST